MCWARGLHPDVEYTQTGAQWTRPPSRIVSINRPAADSTRLEIAITNCNLEGRG